MNEEKDREVSSSLPTRTNPQEDVATSEREAVDLISVSDDMDVLDKMVQATDRMVETYKKIRSISLRLTNEDDWSFQGEGLYLASPGSDKMAVAWGVDTMPEKIEREDFQDADGRYYVYTVTGTAFSRKLGRMVREIGTCSSRDDFFGRITKKLEDGSLVKEWKALEKVDVTDVKKKAVTNFSGRAIKRVIGLGSVTVEELSAAKLDLSKIARVEFKKDKKTAEANVSPALKIKRGEIESIAEFLSTGIPEAKAAAIKAASLFKADGKDHFFSSAVEVTSEKWADATIGRLKGKLKEQFPEEFTKRYPANRNEQGAGQSARATSPTARTQQGDARGSR